MESNTYYKGLSEKNLMNIQGGKGPSKFDLFIMGWEFMEGVIKGYNDGRKKWRKLLNK